MLKVLVIGSKGFIGSYTYHYFKGRTDYTVYGCDIVNDYNDPNYFQISSSNADFSLLIRKTMPDWCINCAGASSVPNSFLNPLRDFSLNVNNIQKILFSIKEDQPFCKLIQLSSAAVYGDPQALPVVETSELKPLSPYGIHKKQAEESCKTYYDHFGIGSFIVRIFSAYGAGLSKQLFWDLYQKLNAKDDVIKLFGTGNESRDFIHVSDIVQCFELIIKNAKVDFEIFNVANGKQLKISAAAQIFKKLGGFNKEIVFLGDNRIGDPLNWEADIQKITKLGYKSQTSLEEGLKDYISWLRD